MKNWFIKLIGGYTKNDFIEMDSNWNDILSIFSKKIKSQDRYKEVFIWICNGMHHYKFLDNDINKDNYERNIRYFFDYIRWIQIDQDMCTNKKYEEILEFIKDDFYKYFSGITNEIDFEKLRNICENE